MLEVLRDTEKGWIECAIEYGSTCNVNYVSTLNFGIYITYLGFTGTCINVLHHTNFSGTRFHNNTNQRLLTSKNTKKQNFDFVDENAQNIIICNTAQDT